MSRDDRSFPPGRSPAASRALPLALLVALLLAGSAAAHQSLLFAHVSTRPDAPLAGEPFELLVHLTDSSHRDVGRVELVASLTEVGRPEAEDIDAGGAQEGAGATPLDAEPGSGLYRGLMPAHPAGEYRLTLVELVDGETETSASAEIEIGGEAVDMQLVLPPSGRNGLGTWLVWLVGLPLLAGLLVTLLVLTGRPGPEAK
jgi:hypothetical protein